jgi:protein-disulfide isomerase/uncharacterized membrane protein
MKTLTKITLLSSALAVFVHIYLSFHYYPIKFGFSSGPSICSINATFDCDAVAASSYSDVLGVPVALWGMAANFVIFILVLGQWWGFTEHPERLRRWAFVLISLSALASVAMGALSLTMHSYCLFCITAYVLSIIMFFCYRATLQEPLFANLGDDLFALWSESKGIAIGFIAIPVIALVSHRVALEFFGVTEIDKIVQSTILEWKSSPATDFNVPPALSMGPARDKARIVISEFADFRCHHCKNAYPSLDHFAKSHPEVRLEFYNFPLDGECNEMIPDKSGISCRFAYAVMCAEKQGKGWEMHHAIYDDQDAINGEVLTSNAVGPEVKKLAENLKLNADQLLQCTADPTVMDAVRLQAKLGGTAKIQGTPSIFYDGRMVNRGQLIPVMEAAIATTPAK